MSDFAANDIALLQVDEVARLVKVSNKTVRRWIDANEIAVVRLGRSVRISQAELVRFITERTSSNNVESKK